MFRHSLYELMLKTKKRILIIRCGRLGDTAVSTVILNPLRHIFKDIEIDWVTKSEVADIFQYEGDINPIRFNHTKIQLLLDIRKLRLIFRSFMKPYDAVFNLEVSKKYDYLVRLLRSSRKYGRPYNHIPDNRTEHRANHQMKIIDECGMGYPKEIAIPSLKCPERNVLTNIINDVGNYIVVSPSTSKFGKKNHRGYRDWPIQKWKKLIDILYDNTNYQIVITGTKNDYYKFLSTNKGRQDRVINLAGKLSIPEYLASLKYAKHVIGVDSASIHIASAVGSENIIAIFGPTSISVSKPFETRSNQVKVISKKLSCSPCYATNIIKQCKDNVCMKSIEPREVLNIIRVR